MARPGHQCLLVCALACLVLVLVSLVAADSAGDYDLPGPGLAYGGIPYGSVSGNLAAYFRRGGASYQYKPGVTRGVSNSFYDLLSRDFD